MSLEREGDAAIERLVTRLAALGWETLDGDPDVAESSRRVSLEDTLLKEDLTEAMKRMNLRDGQPWLDDSRLSDALGALEWIMERTTLDANQSASELIHKGISVMGELDWDKGKSQLIKYINWTDPSANRYTAMRNFRADPMGRDGANDSVVPLMLFVNGIPLVAVYGVADESDEALSCAVDELRRLSDQRRQASEEEEGNSRLFYTSQIMLVVSENHAWIGALGATTEGFFPWGGPEPFSDDDVRKVFDVASVNEVDRMASAILRPDRLLPLSRHFTTFRQIAGVKTKLVARRTQYMAVERAIERIQNDGARGGVMVHACGSGKSVALGFLVSRLSSIEALHDHRIVVVTDRKELERQFGSIVSTNGEREKVSRNAEHLKLLLSGKGRCLVVAVVQKFAAKGLVAQDEEGFGVLNDDENVILLVDEEHRQDTKTLHRSILSALPNASRICFSGTPLTEKAKEWAGRKYGPIISELSNSAAVDEGLILPLECDHRVSSQADTEAGKPFPDLVADVSDEVISGWRSRFRQAEGELLDAPELIRLKAIDMLEHYVTFIMPGGHKAQIVANSHAACMEYHMCLAEAREDLVERALSVSEEDADLDDAVLAEKPAQLRAAVMALRQIEVLRQIDFAPVLSQEEGNDPEWKQWSSALKAEPRLNRFRKPLQHSDPLRCDPLSFLICRSKLLGGFDSPVQAVLYLDRPLKGATLLQAVARVNRTSQGKPRGYIVDYCGSLRHAETTLAGYPEDAIAALKAG